MYFCMIFSSVVSDVKFQRTTVASKTTNVHHHGDAPVKEFIAFLNASQRMDHRKLISGLALVALAALAALAAYNSPG